MPIKGEKVRNNLSLCSLALNEPSSSVKPQA